MKKENRESKVKSKIKNKEITDEQICDLARLLANKMLDAVKEDNLSNSARKPALKKLLMLDEVCKELRKLAI